MQRWLALLLLTALATPAAMGASFGLLVLSSAFILQPGDPPLWVAAVVPPSAWAVTAAWFVLWWQQYRFAGRMKLQGAKFALVPSFALLVIFAVLTAVIGWLLWLKWHNQI